MKKGKTMVLFLVICLIISVSVVAMQNTVTITPNVFEKSDDILVIRLDIPKISGMANNQNEALINEGFNKEATDFYKEVEKQAKEDYIQSKKQGLYFINYEVNYKYLVMYNKNGILSMPIDVYSYTGGAHGITVRKSNNFDINTGQKLLLKDLFKAGYDYKSIFDGIIKTEINKNKDNYFEGSFKGVNENSDYYLTDKGIIVYFQLYEIAPYAAGIPEFLIPYSLIENGLKYKLSK